MKKRRVRVQGRWSGICSTYLAKLAGVAPITARRYLKQFGSAKKNNCTIQDLRAFIFLCEAQKIEKSIRKDISSGLADDMLNFLSGTDFTKI